MVNDYFRPMFTLENLYDNVERIYSFRSKTISDFNIWKEAFSQKLLELLGGFPDTKTDLAPQIVSTKDLGQYTRTKVIINSTDYSQIPLYLLIPKNISGKVPAVIAVSGHGYGKDDIVGLWEDGKERNYPEGYQMNFAVELVKKGFVVAAPEMSGFGERREEKEVLVAPEINSCKDASLISIMMGKTLMGTRVYDVTRCIDYLETVSQADSGKIGIMGISGGGTVSIYAGALEKRIKAVVLSGCLGSYKGLLWYTDHCMCNYIPGILKYGEMYDVAAMIAPKPLFVENGDRDKIFNIDIAIDSFNKVKKAYELLDMANKIDSDFFEGRHRISGAKSYDWLVETLNNC